MDLPKRATASLPRCRTGRLPHLLGGMRQLVPGCEVILATGSDVEGEATATYLHHLLKNLDCKVSLPTQGLAAGSGLTHADTLTLMKALEGRTVI